MNKLVASAAIVAAITSAVHIFMGGPEIAAPLLVPNFLPVADELRLVLYVCWHIVSVALVFSAAALARSAMPRHAPSSRALVQFISIMWLGFATVFIAVALWHGGIVWLLKLPQWVLLGPVGVLGLLGASRSFQPNPLRGPA